MGKYFPKFLNRLLAVENRKRFIQRNWELIEHWQTHDQLQQN